MVRKMNGEVDSVDFSDGDTVVKVLDYRVHRLESAVLGSDGVSASIKLLSQRIDHMDKNIQRIEQKFDKFSDARISVGKENSRGQWVIMAAVVSGAFSLVSVFLNVLTK